MSHVRKKQHFFLVCDSEMMICWLESQSSWADGNNLKTILFSCKLGIVKILLYLMASLGIHETVHTNSKTVKQTRLYLFIEIDEICVTNERTILLLFCDNWNQFFHWPYAVINWSFYICTAFVWEFVNRKPFYTEYLLSWTLSGRCG